VLTVRACGCRILCRGCSCGVSVLVDESVAAGGRDDLRSTRRNGGSPHLSGELASASRPTPVDLDRADGNTRLLIRGGRSEDEAGRAPAATSIHSFRAFSPLEREEPVDPPIGTVLEWAVGGALGRDSRAVSRLVYGTRLLPTASGVGPLVRRHILRAARRRRTAVGRQIGPVSERSPLMFEAKALNVKLASPRQGSTTLSPAPDSALRKGGL
jgi:hypothetical protein